MKETLSNKIIFYQITTVVSVIFALTGFSYNVWRMEVSERNNNVRTACFEMLTELASLEQTIYSAVYDGDLKEGSPRKAWVKVGLVNDLSMLTSPEVEEQARALKSIWSDNWKTMLDNGPSRQSIINAIEMVRMEIKTLLSRLE